MSKANHEGRIRRKERKDRDHDQNERNDRNEQNDAKEAEEARERRQELRDDARQFILDSASAGVPAMQILDELATFYDGDIIDLFP